MGGARGDDATDKRESSIEVALIANKFHEIRCDYIST
jgi:hypothetical protein